MIDGLWLAVRAGAYLLVLQASGACMFLVLFRISVAAAARVARTARRCAYAALGICIVQLLFEPAYLAGEAAGMFDPSLQHLVLHSRTALAAGLRIAAMACVILALRVRSPRALGSAGVCLVLVSFVIAGHTVTAAARWALMPLLGLHVLAVCFWLGALWPLRQLAGSMEPGSLAALLRDFSRLALRLVPLLGLAGVAMACLLLPGIAALGTAYGLLLCTKALLFVALLGLAALNRLRFTPALDRGTPGTVQLLRRSLAAEYGLVVLVLCVTAALTGLVSPTGH